MDLNSIVLYLFVFSVSIIFTAFAENMFDRNKAIGIICSIIAIGVPCLLASARDISVGYDVKSYLMENYYLALRSSNYFAYVNDQYFKVEFLFGLLVWLLAKTENLYILFGIIELLIIGPVYYTLYLRRKESSITLGMIVFLFLFYNATLSCMRQGIAMAFLILALQMMYNNKKISAVVITVIAALFHSSVFLIVPIFFLSYYIYNRPEKEQKRWYWIIGVFLIVVFIFYSEIAEILVRVVSLVSTRYGYFINKYINIYHGIYWENVPLTDMISKFVLILMVYFFLKLAHQYDKNRKYMILMMLVGRYFVLFNARFYEALRIAYYFDYLLILFVPNVMCCVKKGVGNRILISFLMCVPCILYWYHFIMTIGGYQTNYFIFR